MKVSAEPWQAIVSGERRGLGGPILRTLLKAASLPYGVGVRTRNKLFDWGWKKAHLAGVPVVSIGNLTLGGTGKTPCVEYVAGFYRQHDYQVAILSRGYGAEGGRNDEAMLLEENLPAVPHLQGPNRVELAKTAVEELESEVVVLDDGFQHRRLARDLDVVLIDATNPWGHGHLFPRGAMREPRNSLRRAGFVMLTRIDRVPNAEVTAIRQQVARHAGDVPLATTRHAPVELLGSEDRRAPLDELRGKTVAAFAGIGNPAAFRRTLEELGASVADFRVFPDHHGYTREDVDDLRRWAEQQPADALMATTQKDLVKLRIPDLAGRPLWAVRIGLDFVEGKEAFDRRLLAVVPQREEEQTAG